MLSCKLVFLWLYYALQVVYSQHDTTTSPTHEAGEEHEDETDTIEQILLLIPFCMLIGIAIRHITIETKIPVPYTVTLLLVGLFLGWLETVAYLGILGGAIQSVKDMSPHLLLGAFIPPLVFESAFDTNYHIIRREFSSALLLAGPGVVINTLLTAVFCFYAFPYNWTMAEAVTFGSIVSATDPVAVVALLRDLGASPRLATLIEGESLLNDGSAMVLYIIALEFVKGNDPNAGEVVSQFCVLTFGGVLTGILFGIFVVIWLRLVFNDERIEITLTLCSAYLCFHVCETEFGASGILGVVFLGLFISKYKSAVSPQVENSMHHFWEVFGFIFNTLVFLFAGIIVVLGVFEDTNNTFHSGLELGWLICLYIMLHVIRAITVGICWYALQHLGYGITWQEGIVLVYGGLRGVIGLALAMLIKLETLSSDENGEETPHHAKYKDQVMFFVSGTVLLTLIVNGTSMGFIVSKLGLTATSDEAIMILEEAMLTLRRKTKEKMDNIKDHPHFSGAHWEEVVGALPSFAHLVGHKDDTKRSAHHSQKCCLWACCCGCFYGKHGQSSKHDKSHKYGEISQDPSVMNVDQFKDIQEINAIRGRHNASRMMSKRFGVDSYSTRKAKVEDVTYLAKIDDTDNADGTDANKQSVVIATTTELTVATKKEEEGVPGANDDNDNGNDDGKSEEEKNAEDSFKEDAHWDYDKQCEQQSTHHSLNTLRTSAAFGSSVGNFDLPKLAIQSSLEMIVHHSSVDNANIRDCSMHDCAKQIRHRLLLILARKYSHFFSEGVISTDSYMILEHASANALDDDNLEQLSQTVLKAFRVNPLIKFLYKKWKTPISQYLLLNSLSHAMEVGLVFVYTYEDLRHSIRRLSLAIMKHSSFDNIFAKLHSQVDQIREEWIAIQEEYPEIYAAMQTRHAVQTIIHSQTGDILEMFTDGIFDESEYHKFMHVSLQAEHELFCAGFYGVSDVHASDEDRKRTLINLCFMTKLNAHTDAYQNRIQSLFDDLDVRHWSKDETVCEKDSKCEEGIYVIVAGTASLILKDLSEFHLFKGAIVGGYECLSGNKYIHRCVAKTSTLSACLISKNKLDLLFVGEDDARHMLWKQSAAQLILTKYKSSPTSFFVYFGKIEITKMCQESTFREFEIANNNNNNIMAIEHIVFLLTGTAKHVSSNQSYKSPDIILPNFKKYKFSQNAKILIFDRSKHSMLRKMGVQTGVARNAKFVRQRSNPRTM